jgi:hypothetical protein
VETGRLKWARHGRNPLRIYVRDEMIAARHCWPTELLRVARWRAASLVRFRVHRALACIAHLGCGRPTVMLFTASLSGSFGCRSACWIFRGTIKAG